MPYVLPLVDGRSLTASVVLTFTALFVVGSLRALVTIDRWWMAGLEMLGLGAVVAVAAYGSGALVSWLIPGFG
jgi:VIT1/CCC1 family predicted Fe2+/Mn2+ transporter